MAQWLAITGHCTHRKWSFEKKTNIHHPSINKSKSKLWQIVKCHKLKIKTNQKDTMQMG